jgi:hypothetical protein
MIVLRRTGLVLMGMLVLAAAGCTADGHARVATVGGQASPTASAGPDPDWQNKFVACMREQGVNMPDPDLGNGLSSVAVPDQANGGPDPLVLKAATDKCQHFIPDGGTVTTTDQQALERQRKFASCMRDNGIAQFPDPNPKGYVVYNMDPAKGGMDMNSPAFKAATEACTKYDPPQDDATPTP